MSTLVNKIPLMEFTGHEKFCYGCDEARNGYLVRTMRALDDGLRVLEMACLGCMNNLDCILQFSIPFAQVSSHEGSIQWAISRRYYEKHKALFTGKLVNQSPYQSTLYDLYMDHSYRDNDKRQIKNYESKVVHFEFTDDGEELSVVRALLQSGIDESRW